MALPLLLLLALAPQTARPAAQSPAVPVADVPLIEVVEETWEPWFDHLQPTAGESAFAKIAWHPTFAEGILAANQAQRPLLLWVMNGHPLGCT